jgi:glycosyltransferase involved in cell wall biosynthesis
VINDKTVAVVLPAYNAARTLQATVDELPGIVDYRILVDDGSSDETVARARALGLSTFVHEANGYGRNQMTCYREALRAGADIVVMVHPDYQYHAAASDRDGQHDRVRCLRRRSWVTDSRRHRPCGRDA